MILAETIKRASRLLRNYNISPCELDAQIILSDIMGVTKEFLIINDKINVPKKIRQQYYYAIKRRIKREPVAYITGRKEFWSHNFAVNYSTLIPRPETELLIYKVVDFFKGKKINILDIGTGSGCILLSLLRELNFSRGTGIDVSRKAIQMAETNSKELHLSNRSKFRVFDINEFYIGKYDLIVSNPPYISSKDLKKLSKDIVNYEPLVALNGGLEGLDLIKKVIYKSDILLKRNGLLAIEIGYGQYQKVSAILRQRGFREVSKEYDNNCNVRCIMSTKANFY